MAFDGEVKASEPIARQGISAALQYDRTWFENFHHFPHDGLEQEMIALVIDSIVQWYVERIVLSTSVANVLDVACTGKVVSELMERDGHDPVGSVKRLLHSVPVVDVDINIQNTLRNKTKNKYIRSCSTMFIKNGLFEMAFTNS